MTSTNSVIKTLYDVWEKYYFLMPSSLNTPKNLITYFKLSLVIIVKKTSYDIQKI